MRIIGLLTILTIGCASGGGGDLPGGGGSGDGGAGDMATTPSGPITLQDLMGGVTGDSSFYLRFTMNNARATTSPIVRVDTFTIGWPGDNGDLMATPMCMDTPWVASGPQSGSIYVTASTLLDAAVPGTYLSYDCGTTPKDAINKPPRTIVAGANEHVTITVTGITSDSSTFTASATTKLMP